jgi:hypothetical protein
MTSMTLASAAWGCWWLDLVALRFLPDVVPSFAVVSTVASLLAAGGLATAVWAVRGSSRVWLALALIPVLANASLLAVPFLIDEAGLRQAIVGGG